MKARAIAELVEMSVMEVTLDPASKLPVIVLRDEGAETLALWCGVSEAQSIAAELEKLHLERPIAHDLLKTLVAEVGLHVDRVVLHDIIDETFYATIFLARSPAIADGAPGESTTPALELDARPSDAIALALRTGARIFVSRRVLEASRGVGPALLRAASSGASGGARRDDDSDKVACGGDPEEATTSEGPSILHLLSDEDFGKWKM